jgi:F-type H+-transporting ATPase subunit delta
VSHRPIGWEQGTGERTDGAIDCRSTDPCAIRAGAMVNVSVARRYARALLDAVIATPAAEISEPLRSLGDRLSELVAQSRELADALSNTGSPVEHRRKVLEELTHTLSIDAEELKDFFRHLVEHGRYIKPSEVRQAFQEIVGGGTTEQVSAQLEALVEVGRQQGELRRFFADPTYTRAQQRGVMEALMTALPIDAEPLPNFLRLLVDRQRLAALPEIARAFRNLADERAGRIRGKVVSATPLGDETLRKLARTLESISHAKVVLQAEVDPAVIGGVSAQVGSVLYDGTLRTELEEIRRALKR